MNDNIRRLRAVRTALLHIFPEETSKRLRRHLETLAGLVSALAVSSVVHLPRLALLVPDRSHPESRLKRFSRFLANAFVSHERFYEPVARQVVATLSQRQALILVFDASALARGCAVLVVSALYGGRALPLCWTTRRGSKGAFSTKDHLRLLDRVAALVPQTASVVLLGDGEFDAPSFQRAIDRRGWHYVLRTSGRTWLDDGFTHCQARELVVSERLLALPGALVTRSRYGPVLAVAWHEPGHQRGLYLVTNLAVAEEALFFYRRRFQVETLFSDHKRRGFGLQRSHLSDPERVGRLFMAVSLAYLWLVFLGAQALAEGWYRQFMRSARIDLSLFQIGRRAVDYLLNHRKRLRVAFLPRSLPPLKSVR